MIVEQRTYTLRAGTVAEYLKVYEQEGLSAQKEHLPHMVGYYFSEIGDLNQVVHMRAYQDLKHREECRAALFNDARWQIVVKKLYTFTEHMDNKILVPTRFSPGLSEGSR